MGVADVTLALVNEYQLYLLRKNKLRDDSKALARVTVRTYLRHLKIFLRYCYQENFLGEDVAAKMRLPKAEKPMIEILSDNEIHKILAYVDSMAGLSLRNKAMVGLMLDSGLRVGEVVGLKLSSVHLADGYMYVTGKGRKGRLVPLGAQIRLALEAYIASRPVSANEALFLNSKGKPITFNVIKTLCFRIKKRVGIRRLYPHLFRHTYATNFLLAGLGDIYELSLLLGHSDVSITERYLHIASYQAIMKQRGTRSYLDVLGQQKPEG